MARNEPLEEFERLVELAERTVKAEATAMDLQTRLDLAIQLLQDMVSNTKWGPEWPREVTLMSRFTEDERNDMLAKVLG